nr:2241_t:CDS:2 [Entrophospora candida]
MSRSSRIGDSRGGGDDGSNGFNDADDDNNNNGLIGGALNSIFKTKNLVFNKTKILNFTPTWLQVPVSYIYRVSNKYQILRDLTFIWAALFAIPLFTFIVWTIGSLSITLIIWLFTYFVVNIITIGTGFLILLPIAAITFFTSIIESL